MPVALADFGLLFGGGEGKLIVPPLAGVTWPPLFLLSSFFFICSSPLLFPFPVRSLLLLGGGNWGS